ncbi:FecR family protein [Larkinella humicola]|uniref:FecR family protein n=1 Tax=Larkinella humicola TaxID=2607654 RepID=A0A5N1JH19_9BACT|nr:FecR family protein [Larkinella humicola]KAA9350019.1 FecR family protein [Larkinella humicola]
MKNYETYTVEDFIRDEDFQDWVRGRGSRDEFWRSFLKNYPGKQTAFQQAEQFIRAINVAPERLSEAEIRKETETFIDKASAYSPKRYAFPEPEPVASRPDNPVRWLPAIAAVFVAVMGFGWYFFDKKPEQPAAQVSGNSAIQLVETTNDSHQLLRVVLNDSSEVLLSPQSRLRYPSQFSGNSRIVYLQGEGSFSVKRQRQPFMVYTGEMITQVLGTRFVVRAFDRDQKITVQVLSGKVSVYKKKPEQVPDNKEVNGLILNANQAAIFEKSDGNLTKTLVAKPLLIAKRAKEIPFVYDEVPLPVILHELEKSYGIPIQFDEQLFESSKITAILSSESLYEKLDLLCKASSASYEITDGQIVISRKGYR